MGVTSRQMKLNQCHAAVTAMVATAWLWQLWLEKGELCGLAKNAGFKNLPSVVLSQLMASRAKGSKFLILYSSVSAQKGCYRLC